MQRLAKTKFFKVSFIAALLVLLIFANPRGFFNPVRAAVSAAFSPFQKVFYSLSLAAENTGEFFSSVGQFKKENERLILENRELLSENASLHDMEKENELFRQQLGLIPRDSYDLVAASVISQDPNGMGNWIEIDKGSDDGIAEGMAVIVSKSVLLGRVQEVAAHSAKVTLLSNPKSTINVMDVESSAKGVAKGEYGLGIIFDMILQTDSVQVGNTVVTSGIGGVLPRGLYVGTVQQVRPSDDHLFQQAVVTQPVQVSDMQIVFVIKGNK